MPKPTKQQVSETITELQSLLKAGYTSALLPLLSGDKKPSDEQWPSREYTRDELISRANAGANFGLRLDRLCAVDVEHSAISDQICEAIERLYPDAPKRTRPGSHSCAYLFRTVDDLTSWKIPRPPQISGDHSLLVESIAGPGRQLHALGHRKDAGNARLHWSEICMALDLPALDAADADMLAQEIMRAAENAAGMRLSHVNGRLPSTNVDANPELMSKDMLAKALKTIPNNGHFETRDEWMRMLHAIFGASDGAHWGLDLWTDWSLSWDGEHKPGAIEQAWHSIPHDTCRSGAGYIRQQLERVGASDVAAETKVDGFDVVEQKKAEERKARASIICLADVRPENITWLWDGHLARGKFHLLAGESTAGKTTVALKLAAIASTGAAWPDGSNAPTGNVMVWTGEDGLKDTIVPRLIASGADMRKIFSVQGVTNAKGELLPFDPARDVPKLAAEFKALGGASLLIIDPVISAVSGDAFKANDVRRAMQPLLDIAERYGTAVIGITHFNKGSRGKVAQDRITGSHAFGALSRINLYCVATHDENEVPTERTFVRGWSNIGPSGGGFRYDVEFTNIAGWDGETIGASCAVFGERVAGSADTIISDAEGVNEETNQRGRPNEEAARAMAFLADALRDGPMPSDELMDLARTEDIAERTLKRVKKDMGIVSRRIGNVWHFVMEDIGRRVPEDGF